MLIFSWYVYVCANLLYSFPDFLFLSQINDRYEFPIDMNLDKYLTEDADRSIPNDYSLLSILVHSGDVHGGHYYAYIRPGLDDTWYSVDFSSSFLPHAPPPLFFFLLPFFHSLNADFRFIFFFFPLLMRSDNHCPFMRSDFWNYRF